VQTDGTGAKMNIHALAPNKKGPSRLSLADESVRQIDSSARTRAQKTNRAHTHTCGGGAGTKKVCRSPNRCQLCGDLWDKNLGYVTNAMKTF